MTSKRLTPSTFLATVFGTGFIPFAPGTMGTIFAVAVYLLLPDSLFNGNGWYIFGSALLLLSAFSVWISSRAERILGHDAPSIVIDEVCGYFLTVMLLPHSPLLAVYAFVMFRAFDIAKPFPINKSQRLPRGWGIVVDDLLAGLYANLVIQIMLKIVPKFFGQ